MRVSFLRFAWQATTCGEYDDGSGYGFMVYLKGDTENGIVVAEYDDAETFHTVKNDFSRWLRENIDAVFEFPE